MIDYDKPPTPFDTFLKKFTLFLGLLILMYMCCSCSSTYHLKKAIEKNPELSLTDTVTNYEILKGVKARVQYPVLTNSPYFEINGIEFRTIYVGGEKVTEVICPDDTVITKYVPRVKFITEELSRKEIVERAKDFGEWDKIKIAKSEIFGAFLFGAFCIFAIRLYFKLFT